MLFDFFFLKFKCTFHPVAMGGKLISKNLQNLPGYTLRNIVSPFEKILFHFLSCLLGVDCKDSFKISNAEHVIFSVETYLGVNESTRKCSSRVFIYFMTHICFFSKTYFLFTEAFQDVIRHGHFALLDLVSFCPSRLNSER